MAESCGTCAYFAHESEATNAPCRRYPPVVLGIDEHRRPITSRPNVLRSDWYGEYRRRDAAAD